MGMMRKDTWWYNICPVAVMTAGDNCLLLFLPVLCVCQYYPVPAFCIVHIRSCQSVYIVCETLLFCHGFTQDPIDYEIGKNHDEHFYVVMTDNGGKTFVLLLPVLF